MLKGKLIITKKRLYAAFFFNLFEMKIKLSYNELKLKMQYYCSYQERCHNEVLKKLKTYHVASDEKNNIIQMGTGGVINMRITYTYLSNYDPRYKVEE